ncbi:MAG: hypothetical protein QE277_13125 [Flectobacillus sp.]|nr:hypothetical protein [Flectobacillus sp.]
MKTKPILLLSLLFTFLQCATKNTFVRKDVAEGNIPYTKTPNLFLFFELFFRDSVSVFYNHQKVFKEFVVTKKNGISKSVCLIKPVISHGLIELYIGSKKHKFRTIKGYQYYYLGKADNGNVRVTYTNVFRDYN